jgi:hypothetical protein
MHAFAAARIGTGAMLVLALARHPYSYYTLLRWVVCGVGVYSVFQAIHSKKYGWAWAFGIVSLLFNPMLPVHLDRATWAVVDIAVAALFFISLALVRSKDEGA